jgi:hypothetical protein
MKEISLLLLFLLAVSHSCTSAAAGNWIADACRNKSDHCIHPIFQIDLISELWLRKLDSATFKKLNDIYLQPDATDYWRSDMEAMEEMAIFGKLSDLIKGKTSQEVVHLIGEPRITTRDLQAGHDTISDPQSSLYYFGFNGVKVCLTYSNNICVAVNRNLYDASIEDAAFETTKAFALSKPPEEIAKYLRHDLIASKDLTTMVFRVGIGREWSFHFTNGKCDHASNCI